MPLYEYQCDACGHRFEVIQKYSDPAIETCGKCGEAVRKLVSSPAIQFKGSGWYITDYARAGKTDGGGASKGEGAGGGEGKSEKKTESGSSATSDSKTDAKTESTSKAESKTAGTSTS